MPAPNRSPTTFMPSISGPSITSSGRPSFWRASSASASMKSTTPCTSACERRCSTGRLAPGEVLLAALRPCPSPPRRPRSCARSRRAGARRAGPRRAPAARPGCPRTPGAGPRSRCPCRGRPGSRDTGTRRGSPRARRRCRGTRTTGCEMPPLTCTPGQRCLMPPRGLDEGLRVLGVLLDARADREHVRVEDDVLGREAGLLGEQAVGALADLELARGRVGLALLVEGHHHDGGAVARGSCAPWPGNPPRLPSARSS